MMLPASILTLAAVLGAPHEELRFQLNPGAMLSEDATVAAVLEKSLNAFLGEVEAGAFTPKCVDPASLVQSEFFFKGLRGLGQSKGTNAPTVLKSYTTDGANYFLSIAFTAQRDGHPYLSKIIELKGTPREGGYVFSSPFTDRTADFEATTLGKVTFHHRGPLDEVEARAFVAFKSQLSELAGVPERELDYYVFQSLDELLKCYGFVHDATKCNFLGHDLGFSDDGGRAFMTGSGDPNYVAEFVGEFLAQNLPRAELYSPFAIGMGIYYGGHFLSGEDLDELKAQYRTKLAADPTVDFLEEFMKGRKSSLQRHFYHYVISAFLCQEVIAKRSFDDALALCRSGPEGETFFDQLEAILGVTKANFHATVVRLIQH